MTAEEMAIELIRCSRATKNAQISILFVLYTIAAGIGYTTPKQDHTKTAKSIDGTTIKPNSTTATNKRKSRRKLVLKAAYFGFVVLLLGVSAFLGYLEFVASQSTAAQQEHAIAVLEKRTTQDAYRSVDGTTRGYVAPPLVLILGTIATCHGLIYYLKHTRS